MAVPPKQLIIFGSPGTGKSYHVANEILGKLGVEKTFIRTVFHPDYTYGDFMGKLMPLTDRADKRVTYNFYAGSFLKALAMAYRNWLDAESNSQEPQHVALIVDEINRGNSAAIFGTVFQLLDRDSEGWSEYPVLVSDMEFDKLLNLMEVETGVHRSGRGPGIDTYAFRGKDYKDDEINDLLRPLKIKKNELRIPPNLSLLATMNTSDQSIYYMDAAFKRRWDWQFMDINGELVQAEGDLFSTRKDWEDFADKLNAFIKGNQKNIRNVEDKQIGYWFIKNRSDEPVTRSQVQNKVMFFLWDSVFATNRDPLVELLRLEVDQLATFGDFARKVDDFVQAIQRKF